MGAWGEGPFDNDGAADWAAEFDGADQRSGQRLIREALERAAQAAPDDYLEVDEGQVAVAAAELVAFMVGSAGTRSPYNETAVEWINRTQPVADPSTAELARTALRRVVGANSEVAELWEEAGPAWRASVTELAGRLEGA
jgi:hypothetical protein